MCVCGCVCVLEFEILGYYDYPDCFVGKQKIKRAATMWTISKVLVPKIILIFLIFE